MTTRIAILSDPHGDLVAFQRVIADLNHAAPVNEVLLGGDLAQGGIQPAEIVDHIRELGWPAVRGNADELLIRFAGGASPDEALAPARATHEELPESLVTRARQSVEELGPERIEYLRSLPTSLTRGPYECGSLVLVHATPWSTEDVVMPDAADDLAQRMVRESHARVLAYGHIHTQYLRGVGDSVLMSVGGISGSNDSDPRPAYAIVTLGDTATVEFRRVDWPAEERRAAYQAAGINEPPVRKPGPFPVRVEPGRPLRVWQ